MFQVQVQHKSVVEDNICASGYDEERQNLLISISDVCLLYGYSHYVWSVPDIALSIGV